MGYISKLPTKENAANVFSFLASSILPALLAIYATSLYSRHFAPAEYGRYSLALAIAAPILVLASQWLAQATARFYHELIVKSEGSAISQIISTVNFYVILVFIVIVAVLLLLRVTKNYDAFYYLSGSMYLITSIVATNFASYIIYSGRHHIYNTTMTVASLVSFIFTITLLYHTNLGISSLLLGTALSNVCATVVFYRITNIGFVPASVDNNLKALLKLFIGYGMPLSFWMLMYTVINISDRYILQYFLGSEQVGKYSIHYSLVSFPILAINSPMINIYSPKIMKAAAEKDYKMVSKYINDASKVYVFIGFLAMGLAYCFGNSIPYILISHNYYLDKSFYIYIIAGFTVWNIAMFWHKPMEISKSTKKMLQFISIAACVNLVLNILFVPTYGVNAAAVTTFIAFCIYSLLVFLVNRKTAKLVIDFKQISVCGAISILTVLLFTVNPIKHIDTGHFYGAIAAVTIFITVYSILYIVVNYISRTIDKIVRKGRAKNYA